MQSNLNLRDRILVAKFKTQFTGHDSCNFNFKAQFTVRDRNNYINNQNWASIYGTVNK